jgi:MFS family permease
MIDLTATRGPTFERTIETVLAPVRAFKPSYWPPMMVYFAAGAMGLTLVATQFWIKAALTLSPADLAGIAVWLGLPAVMKMVFGELVDTVRVFRSQRRVYVFLGAALAALGLVVLATAAAGQLTWLAPNTAYVAGSLLIAIGLALQDTAADAMTTEVVERTTPEGAPRPKADIDADLAMVQVIGRLFFVSGMLAVAYLGGVLASLLPYWQVFVIALIVPVISVVGALLVRVDAPPGETVRPTDWRILGGGLAFGAGVLTIGVLRVPFAQEITFLVSLAVISWMLAKVTVDIEPETRTRIFYAALIIFFFRAFPVVGDGYRWFLIDRYGFDERFFGQLETIGTLLTLVTGWLLANHMTRGRIPDVLLALTAVSTVFALPALVLVNEAALRAVEGVTGLGARGLAIIDAAAQSPILNLSMIPMLTLIAIHAPARSRAVWFALMGSFMNVALTAGDLMTKYMNMIFVVERGNYASLPALTISVVIIAAVIPVGAITAWRRHVA